VDYLKIYYNLINSRRQLNRDEYVELHHIIPKSVFGKNIMDDSHLNDVDSKDNIVHLTGREHFVAHWLLHRAFPGIKQFSAGFHAMASLKGKQHKRYTPSSRAVAEARELNSTAQSDPIAQYDLDGKLIKVWKTTIEASKKLKTSLHNLSAATNPDNYVNNIKGFQWRRLVNGKPLLKIKKFENSNLKNSKMVHMYNNKGDYIKTFKSKREVERNGYRIRFGRSKRKIYSKYNWFIISSSPPLEKINTEYKPSQKRKIVQINKLNDEIIKIFDSSREASRITGIHNPGSVANGKRKTAGGYIWKWEDEIA